MNNSEIEKAVGVVVIGRNEGERLLTCLKSLANFKMRVVYVDSGSTDGSVSAAQSLGASVVNLDMQQPFTAARARNEGAQYLIEHAPGVRYIQFVDGDCEVVHSWLPVAFEQLEKNSQLAVVCGRRRERYPDATFYNYMCDLEWNTPIGDAKACGGDALIRIKAFQAVNGFNDTLIAGEEPDMCLRMRTQSWKITRLDAEMTLHDAAMTKFSQWWKRAIRAGHAFAEGAYLHGRKPEKHWVKETARASLWGGLLPLAIVITAFISLKVSGLLCLIYLLQLVKVSCAYKTHGFWNAIKLSFFSIVGKFAELIGQLKFISGMMSGSRKEIIEYK